MRKIEDDLMNSALPMHQSPRCTARSKRSGLRCKAPAVWGWSVCRFHGAGGGGPKGKQNGMYKHGRFTAESIEMRRQLRAWVKELEDAADAIE